MTLGGKWAGAVTSLISLESSAISLNHSLSSEIRLSSPRGWSELITWFKWGGMSSCLFFHPLAPSLKLEHWKGKGHSGTEKVLLELMLLQEGFKLSSVKLLLPTWKTSSKLTLFTLCTFLWALQRLLSGSLFLSCTRQRHCLASHSLLHCWLSGRTLHVDPYG